MGNDHNKMLLSLLNVITQWLHIFNGTTENIIFKYIIFVKKLIFKIWIVAMNFLHLGLCNSTAFTRPVIVYSKGHMMPKIEPSAPPFIWGVLSTILLVDKINIFLK